MLIETAVNGGATYLRVDKFEVHLGKQKTKPGAPATPGSPQESLNEISEQFDQWMQAEMPQAQDFVAQPHTRDT